MEHSILHGRRSVVGCWMLAAASAAYGGLCRLRAFLYRTGMFRQKHLNAYVISVGNLTTGGTGKTPLTLFLATQWLKHGYRVGIVSRGYKGRYRGGPLQVFPAADGDGTGMGPSLVGDEPYLMASRLPAVPVVISKNRYRGGRWLIENFKSEIILLDDGFQHLSLYRDLNLLLVDAKHPGDKLLPQGRLREPWLAARRADVIIATRVEHLSPPLIQQMRSFRHPILRCRFIPSEVIQLHTGEVRPLTDIVGVPIVAFSGIGNPEAFMDSLKTIGADVKQHVVFPDHFAYRQETIDTINRTGAVTGASRFITTEKDAVKVKAFASATFDVWALRIDVSFSDDAWETLLIPYASKNPPSH